MVLVGPWAIVLGREECFLEGWCSEGIVKGNVPVSLRPRKSVSLSFHTQSSEDGKRVPPAPGAPAHCGLAQLEEEYPNPLPLKKSAHLHLYIPSLRILAGLS